MMFWSYDIKLAYPPFMMLWCLPKIETWEGGEDEGLGIQNELLIRLNGNTSRDHIWEGLPK